MDAAEQLMRTVRGRYDQLVAEGVLERDPAQAELASRLDFLSEQLGQTTLAVKGSSLGWLFGRSRPKQPFIRGLYIHGSVGRGKTMLMDLFFERVAVRARRRGRQALYARGLGLAGAASSANGTPSSSSLANAAAKSCESKRQALGASERGGGTRVEVVVAGVQASA